ncbi:hypothetical protein ACLMJK_002602 [Lecanora helva]
MSTVHSTPPPTATGNPSHPIGFNSQTYYDPFFASASNEEHLVPVENDYTPSHHSYQTPSPPQAPTNPSLPFAQAGDHLHSFSHPAFGHPYPSSNLPQDDTNNEAAGSTYDFLSPSAYISDTNYIPSSEHTTTPSFGGNDFNLEDDYGILADLDQAEFKDPLSDSSQQSKQGIPDFVSHQQSIPARTSAGTATLSSHLMSPVLTDSVGPSSRHGTSSPPEKSDIKIRAAETVVTEPFIENLSQEAMNQTSEPSHITPSLTASSKGTSPDLSAVVSNNAHATSPAIRIDGFSTGDSPARGLTLNNDSGRKRSRAGSNMSHLTVQNDDYEENREEFDDYFSSAQVRPDQTNARAGIDPQARNQMINMEIPNLKEQEIQAQMAIKNIDVEEWLDRSEPTNLDKPDAPPLEPSAINKRQRAKSAGAYTLSHANLESLQHTTPDSHIPGPGVLINEESEEDEDDESASVKDSPLPSVSSGISINEKPGEAKPGVYDELTNQPPLYRAKLWQDPLYDSSNPGVKMQPETANAAMKRYEQRVSDIETVSRVATWGTRRVSESDLSTLFHRISFNEKTQEPEKKRDRRGSFLQHLSGKLSSKRSSSNLRRQDSDKSTKTKDKPVRPQLVNHNTKDSQGSRKDSLGVPQVSQSGLKRMSSLGKKPKSPKINTSSAVAAIAFQTSALGAGGSVSATGTSSPTAWPKNIIKRPRSRSELNSVGSIGPASSSATELAHLGLAEMWTRQGGPPMPALATPLKNEETRTSLGDIEDDDEDDGGEDDGVTMDLSLRAGSINPTLEGFKANVRQLNPRLPPFLFDRIAQEQLRRYKKLMDLKIKHTQALSIRKCGSGKHCAELGGEPTYLPLRSNNRETELQQTGLAVAGLAQSDEDVNALAEGTVTPAQFPPGVPMPPVKRLPAEFECSLCYKVKKFYKPSDWSKHVHEDVQPFTCTFATCAEPKSFKRKADWVRHENERHRQLEWWQCDLQDCSHKCYRKDNFVQHLVREHKLPEPKVKTIKTGKPAVRGPSSQKARNRHADDTEESNDEIDYVWRLVDKCRHETPKNPKDETCKFCGNVCNSWKKLTVHLAKHMEQISMPVLGVVKQKEVTPDTIISPIEQRLASQQNSMSPIAQSPFSHTAQVNSISPYGIPASGAGDLSATFASLQTSPDYIGDRDPRRQTVNYQHVSPNTYPPPSHPQQLNAGYTQMGGQNPYVSGYSSYAESPASNFHAANAYRVFPRPQASSPENMYSDSIGTPTSQPRTTHLGDNKGFQYFPPQSQRNPSQMEGGVFGLGNAAAVSYSHPNSNPVSYPTQPHMDNVTPSYGQQGSSPQGRTPMQYMQNINHANAYAAFNASPQQQQQRQQYSYGQ